MDIRLASEKLEYNTRPAGYRGIVEFSNQQRRSKVSNEMKNKDEVCHLTMK